MKANGIHPNGGTSERPTTQAAPREKSKASTTKVAASKKRKIEGAANSVKLDNVSDSMLTKPNIERVKSEPASDESKLTLPLKSSPATTSTPPVVPVQFSPPPQLQRLFNVPQMAYPQSRHYHPHMAHMAHYPAPLLSLPPPPPSPSPLTQCRYTAQQPGILPRQVPASEDRSIFEDFCTPELFEQRTFLEMPLVEHCCPIPPPPQEATMPNLSIEEKPVEGKSVEPRSGRRPSESILIAD